MPAPDCDLSSYHELAGILTSLPMLVRETRRQRRLSLRAATELVGCSAATLHRIEAGEDCALSNAAAVLRWLHAPAPAEVRDAR
jgi:helix-turn-helix protein